MVSIIGVVWMTNPVAQITEILGPIHMFMRIGAPQSEYLRDLGSEGKGRGGRGRGQAKTPGNQRRAKG